MSSASSSTLTPALMRRTLAWLSTSLFGGISRDALNTILVMRFSATGGLESLSCPSVRQREPPSSSPFSVRARSSRVAALRHALEACTQRNSGSARPPTTSRRGCSRRSAGRSGGLLGGGRDRPGLKDLKKVKSIEPYAVHSRLWVEADRSGCWL